MSEIADAFEKIQVIPKAIKIEDAVLPECGSAHVEELNDPYLLWYWNSNIRSTAIEMTAAGIDVAKVIPSLRPR